MAVTVFAIYIAVIIDKIFIPGIVRRIYIDDINFALMGIGKCRK